MRAAAAGGLKKAKASQSAVFKPENLSHIIILILCGAILLAVLILSPPDSQEGLLHLGRWDLPLTCSFRNLTGLPCPGCGLSRSLVTAVRGKLKMSLHYHRLGILTLLYIVLQFFHRLVILGRFPGHMRVRQWTSKLDRGLLYLAVLFGVNWLLTLILRL